MNYILKIKRLLFTTERKLEMFRIYLKMILKQEKDAFMDVDCIRHFLLIASLLDTWINMETH